MEVDPSTMLGVDGSAIISGKCDYIRQMLWGHRFFSSPATVSGENQLRLFHGVEVGGEDEADERDEACGV